MEDKKKNSDKDAISKEIYDHSKNIIEIRTLSKELTEKHENYKLQIEWLKENGLPLESVLPLKRELIELRRNLRKLRFNHDKTNRESGIRLGEASGGLRNLMFSIEMIKGEHLPHMEDPDIDGT